MPFFAQKVPTKTHPKGTKKGTKKGRFAPHFWSFANHAQQIANP
jgi:hypothetical protein